MSRVRTLIVFFISALTLISRYLCLCLLFSIQSGCDAWVQYWDKPMMMHELGVRSHLSHTLDTYSS